MITTELITRLTKLIPIERIYLNDFEYKETKFKELIILLPSSSKLHITEVRPLVNVVMAGYPEYRFRMCYIQEIKHALHYGSMVFYTICREEKLVYQSECHHTELSTDLCAKSVLKKAKRNFKKEWKKVTDFRAGFDFYLKQENYPLAAFMLHQVIELSYRAAELLVIGKEKISHSVRNHQKLMQQYVPELGVIFNEADEDEMSLLALLDEAYRSVRYEDTYAVDLDQLSSISLKADLMEKQIGLLYELIVTQFMADVKAKEELVAKEVVAIEPVSGAEDALSIIVSKICSLVSVNRIYRLGYTKSAVVRSGNYSTEGHSGQKEHFDLLVILNDPCTPEVFNVQSMINQDTGISASVLLLMHHVKHVQEALQGNNRFFHEILSRGHLVYSQSQISDWRMFPKFDELKEHSRRELAWCQRHILGEVLLLLAADSVEDDSGLVLASLLNQALEQICLAFIDINIGYSPNQVSLNHLFAICRLINPVIDEVFPTSRSDDKRIFKRLLDANKDMRYHILAEIASTDQGLLLRRSQEWLRKVEEISEDIRF